VKWFAPTMLLEYKFNDDSAAFRPFVGAGLNFTHFYDRKINAAGDAALGGPTSVSLKNSVGPAATIGVYYRVWHTWHVVGSFSASQVTSTLETNTAGVVRRTNVSFNPEVIVLSVGYSF